MKIKVAGGVVNQIPFDWNGNQKRIRSVIEQARQAEAALVCLPELCITGYGCEDAFFNPFVQDAALTMLFALVPESKGLVLTLGLPISHRGVLYNGTAVLCDGKIVGVVPKKFLAGDGVHYEPRWFKAWPSGEVGTIEWRDQVIPFGDLHFDFEGVKVGLEICEEAWVAQRPGALLAKRGVDVILNPSASHFAFGKLQVRKGFVVEGSRAFNAAYIYTNLVGNEAGRIIFDGGVLIADGGQIVAQGERFSFREASLTCGVVDLGRNRVVRSRTSSYQPDSSDSSKLCISVGHKFTEAKAGMKSPVVAAWEQGGAVKEEEFTRSVSIGLFDFLRKSRQNGFVISLSGGVDSAAVTALCRIALDLAVFELGLEGLKTRLSYIPGIQAAASLNEIAKRLLTCAYQATANSSENTRSAAEAVAKEAGATYYQWSVDEILQEYKALAENALGEKLTWQKHDSTLQNIQARARGPSIWILANVNNALLLATSNRSEAAVGYATMDGDTCGGISPIGGIDKNFLRHWARWISQTAPVGGNAFGAFQQVLKTPPTAELRPSDRHQTDEDDLMPYDILDSIERMAIRDKRSPKECLQTLVDSDPALSRTKAIEWVTKFFRLWCRNQWKRERYAPAFHLDDESLDPKTWCRFPILSSCFEEELRELQL